MDESKDYRSNETIRPKLQNGSVYRSDPQIGGGLQFLANELSALYFLTKS